MLNVSNKFTTILDQLEASKEVMVKIGGVEYGRDSIVSVSTNHQLFPSLSLGNAIAGEISLRLVGVSTTAISKADKIELFVRMRMEKTFYPDTPGTGVYSVTNNSLIISDDDISKQNSTLMLDDKAFVFDRNTLSFYSEPFTQEEIDENVVYSEWLPKGVYFIDSKIHDVMSDILDIHGFDAMMKAEQMFVKDENLGVLESIAQQLDVGIRTYNGEEFNSEIKGIIDNIPESYYNCSCRDMLGQIASAYGGNFIISDTGNLMFVPMKNHDATQNLGFDAGSLRSYGNKGEVHGIKIMYIPADAPEETKEEYSYSYGSDGLWITASIPWATEELAELTEGEIDGFTFHPYDASSVGTHPAVELGDTVNFGSNDPDSKLPITPVHVSSLDITYTNNLFANMSDPYSDDLEEIYGYQNTLKNALQEQKTEAINNLADINDKLEKIADEVANAKGLFPYEQILEDGSKVFYLSDVPPAMPVVGDPTFPDSRVIIRIDAVGMRISTNSGETYETGYDFVSGEAVVRSLIGETLRGVRIEGEEIDISAVRDVQEAGGDWREITAEIATRGLDSTNPSILLRVTEEDIYAELELNLGDGVKVDGNLNVVNGSIYIDGSEVVTYVPEMQHGNQTVSLTANTWTDFSVAFPHTFSSTPDVVFTPRHNSNVTGISYKIKTVTTSGFTGYIMSTGGGTHAIHWIAMAE